MEPQNEGSFRTGAMTGLLNLHKTPEQPLGYKNRVQNRAIHITLIRSSIKSILQIHPYSDGRRLR